MAKEYKGKHFVFKRASPNFLDNDFGNIDRNWYFFDVFERKKGSWIRLNDENYYPNSFSSFLKENDIYEIYTLKVDDFLSTGFGPKFVDSEGKFINYFRLEPYEVEDLAEKGIEVIVLDD